MSMLRAMVATRIEQGLDHVAGRGSPRANAHRVRFTITEDSGSIPEPRGILRPGSWIPSGDLAEPHEVRDGSGSLVLGVDAIEQWLPSSSLIAVSARDERAAPRASIR
jgi:hypothetical protein